MLLIARLDHDAAHAARHAHAVQVARERLFAGMIVQQQALG